MCRSKTNCLQFRVSEYERGRQQFAPGRAFERMPRPCFVKPVARAGRPYSVTGRR